MTVTTTANSILYAGNGTTTAFAFPYIFFVPTDLVVTLVVTATNAPVSPPPVLGGGATYDYTVSGTITDGEYASGGAVTFNTAPITGYTVLLVRSVPATQDVTLIDNTKFPAATVNTEFDKLTVLSQQSSFLSGVSLQIPSHEIGLIVTAAPATLRANKLLLWDASGNLSMIDTANIIGGSVPGGPAGGDLSGSYPNPAIKTSVNLGGSPTTTTAATADNTTKIATTAHVKSAMAAAGGGIIREVTLAAPAATINLFSLGVKSCLLEFSVVPVTDNVGVYLRLATGTTVTSTATYYSIGIFSNGTTVSTNQQPGVSAFIFHTAVSNVANSLTGHANFPDIARAIGNSQFLLRTSPGGVPSSGSQQFLATPGSLDGFQFALSAGNFATGSFVRVIGWP